ncbi:MAG: [FeFe] hydrogenase, group A [Planctomycetaceae bacterium]|jgi:iron-only hydrogenase group A|nr:[FeFe] hydrogenase, group A [Planctomycetaceae bacterium]
MTTTTTVPIEVNGRAVDAIPGEVLLKTLKRAGIHVPTLCYIEGLSPTGACRMCVVEIEGQRSLIPACAFPVTAGLKVQTHSKRAVAARKTIVELLLADHPDDCLFCERNHHCQLQTLAEEFGIRNRHYVGAKDTFARDYSGESIVRDPEKCIKCGKCVRVCEEIQGVACIDFICRGSKTTVGTAFNEGLNISSCVNCGQCVTACPVGALTGKSHIDRVVDALRDPNKVVILQHAPSVSVSLGEEFNLPIGIDTVGLLHAAGRAVGFRYVFDTSFGADLTIMEEATELVQRVTAFLKGEKAVLPMFTSCSPGWIKYVETFYPENIPNLSSCKSPMGMQAAVTKTFFAEKQGIDPKNIFSVAIMPCTAKKFEASRAEMGREGYQDTDAVLTTREYAQLIRSFNLDFTALQPEPADTPFGTRSTAGKIFGVTGGVMEAAIRSAYYFITGKDLPTKNLRVDAVRGLEGIKEAHLDIDVPGFGVVNVGVAVVNGLGNAKRLLDAINSGEKKDLHFIEVMTCPGGCVGGGGQPYGTDLDKIKMRTRALYTIDDNESLRTSHGNPDVIRIYKEYLGEPCGHRAHELLHTFYHEREVLT